jgi:hypothetical protein
LAARANRRERFAHQLRRDLVTADEIRAVLHADPNLAVRVLAGLCVVGPWVTEESTIHVLDTATGRTAPKTETISGRFDILTGDCMADLVLWEGRWWDHQDLEEDRGEGHATLEEAQAVQDARLIAEGWALASESL